jgi:hypothetical protein
MAQTKPLNEGTVRRWFELGSYTKLLPNYREALVRQRGAYKPGARTSAVPASLSTSPSPAASSSACWSGPCPGW